MKFFIYSHIMPGEIDELYKLVMKLKKSSYYFDVDDEIIFHFCMNLTEFVIDGKNSKLSKEFFITKFNLILEILSDNYTVEAEIYEGDELCGHLDSEKKIFSRGNEYDGILSITPDIHFHETLVSTMFEIFKKINNKYFAITPQIPKLGDGTGDHVANKHCMNFDYKDGKKFDMYDAEGVVETNLDNFSLYTVDQYKWASGFDLKNSNTVKDFSIPDDGIGYGQYDTYLMSILQTGKRMNKNFDFKQYVIENQVIAKNRDHNFKDFYKNRLSIKDIKVDLRRYYENNFEKYVDKKINELIQSEEIGEI